MPINVPVQIDPGSALSSQVYHLLRQAIVRSDMQPGERLSDIELAASLGISRQPVREAFLRLQSEDLLDVLPQRGTFVKRISVSAVLDARFVREAIEADIVHLVASSADKHVFHELRTMLQAQRKAAKQSCEQFIKLDDEFHRFLAEAAGKPNAWHVIEEQKAQMDRVRFLSFNNFHLERLIRQHAQIVQSIGAGQSLEASHHMRKHLRGILDSIHLISREIPEYFTEEPFELSDPSIENHQLESR